MKSPAHSIALHLDSLGVGTFGASSGWAISAAREPATPDTTITLYDNGGRDPLLYHEPLRRPSIQARVRGREYPDSYTKLTEIIDALHAVVGDVIDGMRYVHIEMTGNVQSLGTDDNDRYLMTANFQMIRQPVEPTNG